MVQPNLHNKISQSQPRLGSRVYKLENKTKIEWLAELNNKNMNDI